MRVYEPRRLTYHKRAHGRGQNGIFIDCIFCTPQKIRTQVCTSFSFTYWSVVANLHPYMNGNLMLVSRRHTEELDDLTAEEQAEWFVAIKEVKKVLGTLFKTRSFNISINLGEYSGQSLRHLHWQIIPRTGRHQINSINIFSDIYVVSVSAQDLVRMVNEHIDKKQKAPHRKKRA